MTLNLLTHRQLEPVGLDIGTSAVKLVQLRRSDGVYTVAAAVSEPVAGYSDNEKATRRHYAEAVKNCFQKAALKRRNVVCGVSGPEVMVRGFKFGPLPAEAVAQAIGIEAQQVCPLDLKHSVLDYQLVQSAPTAADDSGCVQPRCGVMAVATEHAIHEKTQLLFDVGARALMIDADALALLNCLNELGLLRTAGTAAVIDVGAAFTNVVIYGQDGLPFVRDINIAGGRIVRHICRTLEIPEGRIYELLFGSQTSADAQNKILLALNDAVRPLANAINETLRFYLLQEKGARLEHIFLCGGFARLKAFTEFLADALPAPVGILNPFEVMTCNDSAVNADDLVKDGPAFAVAAGLAMRMV